MWLARVRYGMFASTERLDDTWTKPITLDDVARSMRELMGEMVSIPGAHARIHAAIRDVRNTIYDADLRPGGVLVNLEGKIISVW